MNHNGRYLCIRCPWEHLHTTESDKTATVWFLAGSGRIQQSAFSCRHAHCEHRTTDEFLREVGYDAEGFEIIGPPVERAEKDLSGRDARSERAEGLHGERVSGWAQDARNSPAYPYASDLPERAARHDETGWEGNGHADLQSQGEHSLQGPGAEINSTGQPEGMAENGGRLPRLDAWSEPADRQHPHHEEGDGEGTAEVLTAFGADQAPKNVQAGAHHPLDLPAFERDKNGKIKPKLSNIVLALNRPDLVGAVIGRDEFKDEIAWRPWKQGLLYVPSSATFQTGGTRPFRDADYTAIQLTLTKLKFGPSEVPYDSIRRAVVYIAEQRLFDSAIHWLDTLPDWDGINRIDTFCSRYLGAEDSPYTRAVARYWWSAHAGRVLVPGIQADMAVVLISEQGTGKTSSLKAITPSPEHYVELSLTDRDEDLSRAMRGKLVGEMAELKGVKGKDVESLKAWISRQRELWVPKYLEFTRSFPRRLVLIGTTNEDEFLSDETGNRRWLPLPVGKQDVEALVRDRNQLWAEAVSLYLYEGICWSDAERLARDVHMEYMIHDDWQDTITDWLVADDGFGGGRPGDREYLFLGDILRGALHLNPNQSPVHVQKRVGAILRKMGYLKVVRRIDGESHKVWLKGCKKLQDRSL